jgi:hypothetical protein
MAIFDRMPPSKQKWVCLQCGNGFIATRWKAAIRKYCGPVCYHSAAGKSTHGHVRGGKQSKEYQAWSGMIKRCTPGSSDGYAEKGRSVCEEWRMSFESFLAHVGMAPTPRHTLDRIDNSKGYQPGNVRWATFTQQTRNRTITRSVIIDGISRPLMEVAQENNLNYYSLYGAIVKRGEDPRHAVDRLKGLAASKGLRTFLPR